MLPLGSILIEIALLQRFTLFLGQPACTFAAILASLLVFTGVGSGLAGRFMRDPRRSLRFLVPAVPAMLAVTAATTPWFFDAALGFAFASCVVIAVLLLAPLGIVLGIPFPADLRRLPEVAAALVPWAWGVNGFFTVIGSVPSMILGMALAAFCYPLA